MAIVTHVGRPDEDIHGFSDQEILLIVQGRHGYISPSWYAPGATRAPTWNFTAPIVMACRSCSARKRTCGC